MCFDYGIEKKERMKREVVVNEDTKIYPGSEKMEEYTIRHQRRMNSEMAPSQYWLGKFYIFALNSEHIDTLRCHLAKEIQFLSQY